MKLRLAAIGVRHGHCWGIIDGLLKTGKVELVALAEDHAEMLARARERLEDVPTYTNWKRCLDDIQPDIVSVVTRNVQ